MTKATQKPPPTPHSGWPKEIRASLEKQPFYYPEKKFTDYANAMEPTDQAVFLRDMRLERNFYKKVMEEPHREKRPGSYRYVDAQLRIEILNINGKTLKQLIK